jgi:group I intron endonuclease
VGWTSRGLENRWKAHLKRVHAGNHSKLYDSIRKHGPDVWVKGIIENDLTHEQAKQIEIEWIAKLDTFKSGYNMTEGGDGVCFLGETNPFYGRKHTPESIEKIRQSIGNQLSGESNPQWGLRGELSPCWGRKHSEESKRKIADGNRGKILSEETRQKMSEAARKRPPISEETRQKLREARKKQKRKRGFHLSEEHKQKLSDSQKGKPKPRKRKNEDEVVRES